LVPDLPSPTPAQIGPSGLKQLMTIGQITSTPRILSSSEEVVVTPGTPFHIAGPSQRETVAHKLPSRATKSLKNQVLLSDGGKGSKQNSKTPSMTPRHSTGNLTPAARRLLDRTVGGSVASNRRADAMGRTSNWGVRDLPISHSLSDISWTPTPKRGF